MKRVPTSPGAAGRTLAEAIRGWIAGLAPGVAELVELPIPEDDDYGLGLSLALRPLEPRACPIELGITADEEGPATCVFLDTWAGISQRFGLRLKPGRERLVGLGVEPVRLPAARVVELCDRVAAGAVHLELAARAGSLAGTAGHVELRAGRFPMRGVGFPVRLARGLKLLGMSVERGEYAPWGRSRRSPAP